MPRFVLLAVVAAAVTGCRSDGHLNLLGYTTAPPFDPNIKTVYVPVFKSVALETSPYRGLEVDITKALVTEINSRTPMRVVSDPERADTELLGTLLTIEKLQLNRNKQNHARELELTITTQVVWRDLRTGKILSNPNGQPLGKPTVPAFDPSLPPATPAAVIDPPVPVKVVATGRVLVEVGESTATGTQMAVKQMAKQIVNMMERPQPPADPGRQPDRDR